MLILIEYQASALELRVRSDHDQTLKQRTKPTEIWLHIQNLECLNPVVKGHYRIQYRLFMRKIQNRPISLFSQAVCQNPMRYHLIVTNLSSKLTFIIVVSPQWIISTR